MSRYLIFRAIQGVPVLALVSIVAFAVVALLPGDAGDAMLALGAEYYSPQAVSELRAAFGLDQPLHTRYLMWLRGALTGNFGRSLRTNEPVAEAIVARLPTTFSLAIGGLLVGVAVGTSFGLVAAIRRGSWLDRTLTVVATLGLSVPHFWLGLTLLIIFSQVLPWLPAFGYAPVHSGLGPYLRHLVLPWVTLGTGLMAEIMRQVRSSMLEELSQDYIRTARAKGLAEWSVKCRHALKNALIPVITLSALSLGRLLSGVVVVESVFSLPGLGSLAITAFGNRDFTVLQAMLLFSGVVTFTVSLLADVAYAYVDPRIRYD